MSRLRAPAVAAVAAGVLLLAAAAAALAVGWSRAVLVSPPATPLLEDREGSFLSEGEREYRALGYWDVEGPLNPRLVLCVTQIEDSRFFEHPGVDPRSLLRAILNNLGGGPRQGASSIAMQVARLEYPAPRSALNKLLEMGTALFLVARQGREAVLRHYLKIIPQGNQIFGVGYAARRFFRKPVADLSLAECALLASLPKAPGRMNLFSTQGFAAARGRATLVLRLLGERGLVGGEDWASAAAQLAAMERQRREDRPPDSYHFILRALEEERLRPARSYARPLAASLDSRIQDEALRLAALAVEENRRYDAGNAAIIVADRASGEVLAYVGSRDYYDPAGAGAIDYARTPRSSGSALKPFLFALGLDSGAFTPASVLADLPFAVLSPQGEYRALNFDDDYLGPMLYRRALANSRNVPALRVLEGVGIGRFLDLARDLGLARGTQDADFYGYGLAIGGLYVTLEDLVAAYGCLAGDGREFRLSFFRGGAGPGPSRQVLSPYAAREIVLCLSDSSARYPSFPRRGALEYGFPVAVKTGTSQGYRDAWTVAWSARYLVGVWIGDPDNRPMNRVAGVVSASYAARLMAFLHPEESRGVDARPFPIPESADPMELCVLSGQEAGPDCPATSLEFFRPGEAPRGSCQVHRRLAVDRKDGRLASATTPASRVVSRVFTVLPPEYALWGARRGFSPPPEGEGGGEAPSVRIAYPPDGGRYLVDPGAPASGQSLPLQATVSPRAAEILWWVDGSVFARAPYPYSVRLPLLRGRHRIAAGLPGAAEPAAAVTITVE